MRNPLSRGLSFLFLGWTSGVLWAAPKGQEAYLVHPSTQTIKRREAAFALGHLNEAASGPKLLEALADKDPMTRTLAIQGLGTMKYSAAEPKLAVLLATDSYAEVRQAAAVSLRQIDDPRAVDPLGKALGDAEPHVRLAALSGIARYRQARSRPLVEAICKDPSVEIRRTAVYVLGQLEDPAAVPMIHQLLKDPDSAVRAGAAQALGEFRQTDSTAALQPLLQDPDKTIKASAARSLLMLGDVRGFEPAKALANDPSLVVRTIAIDALGWSKDPAAQVELRSLLAASPANSRPAIQEALTRTQQLRKQ